MTDFQAKVLKSLHYKTISSSLAQRSNSCFWLIRGGACSGSSQHLRSWTDHRQAIELNEIVLKACAKEPARRYQSAEAMLADLKLLKGGKRDSLFLVSISPASTLMRAKKPKRSTTWRPPSANSAR